MVTLRFCDRAGAIHEVQGCLEIGKQEGFLQMMTIHDLPIGKLRGQLCKRLTLERRNSAATRHAALIGEVTHRRSTQTSLSPNSTGYVLNGRTGDLLVPQGDQRIHFGSASRR